MRPRLDILSDFTPTVAKVRVVETLGHAQSAALNLSDVAKVPTRAIEVGLDEKPA